MVDIISKFQNVHCLSMTQYVIMTAIGYFRFLCCVSRITMTGFSLSRDLIMRVIKSGTYLRTEHVAANETFPPINGSLFMNFENSVHSWSIADCLKRLKRPSPSETNCQTSTISKFLIKIHHL